MVARLVVGILALTLLPLGVVFLAVGAVVDEPRRGRPEDFVAAGAVLALVGAGFALAFALLSRRAAARRRRRREGTRAMAEVVRADLNPSVRKGASVLLRLTVRLPAAGTPGGTVTGKFFVVPPSPFAVGEQVEIVHDPADPANFEPVALAG